MKALKSIINNKKVLVISFAALLITVLLLALVAVVFSPDQGESFEDDGTESSVEQDSVVDIESMFKPALEPVFDNDSLVDEPVLQTENSNYILAKIYKNRRQYDKSNHQFDIASQVLSGKYTDSIIYYKMENFWNLGNFDKVLELGKKVSQKNIPQVEFLKDRSTFELAINKSDTSLLNSKLKQYESDYNFKRKDYEFVVTYAYLIYKSGANYELASSMIDRAIMLNKNRSFYPYTLRGLSMLNTGKYEKAEKYFYDLLKMFPYNYRTHLYLGKSYYAQEKYTEALYNFEVSLAIMKSDVGFFNSGMAYVKLEKDSLAFEMFKESYNYNHKNVNNLYEIVKIYQKNDKIDKSILLLERVLDIIVENYGELGIVHKKYMKLVIKLYREKDTEKFELKAKEMIYKLCVIDPKDQESLEIYEEINREIFRIKEKEYN